MNERRIMEAVQASGEISRASLVRLTGISAPTVSKLVKSLLDLKMLEEGDAPGAVPGRPARVLRLAQQRSGVLGALVDIHECSVAATGLDGLLHEDRMVRFPTPDNYPALLDALEQNIRALMAAHDQTQVLALGLSVPGLIDRRQQQVLLSSNLHLLDERFPGRDLQQRLGLLTILLHETDATCLGQRAYGKAKGMNDFVLIDVTSGVGAAIMSDGKIVTGHSGMAGEVGHITVVPGGEGNAVRCGCGNMGCLETVASDLVLAELISQRRRKPTTIEEAIELSQAGKLRAGPDIDRTINYLAIGLAAVVNIFNPAAVLVQGRMFDLGEGLFEKLLENVGRRALAPAFGACQIMRASGSKLQNAVAGTIYHLTTVIGPSVQ
jgi:N-acetylglucosamine repressor